MMRCVFSTKRIWKAKSWLSAFQTVAELWSWAEENDWGTTLRAGLEIFLQKFLVIPYDPELAQTWARLTTHCKRIGRRLEAGDAWIAASAVHYKLVLLTHDLDQVSLFSRLENYLLLLALLTHQGD